MLIGDKIPEDYKDSLGDHEVFAPVTTAEQMDYVSMLIEDFLEEFKDLYPERPITPKMHI